MKKKIIIKENQAKMLRKMLTENIEEGNGPFYAIIPGDIDERAFALQDTRGPRYEGYVVNINEYHDGIVTGDIDETNAYGPYETYDEAYEKTNQARLNDLKMYRLDKMDHQEERELDNRYSIDSDDPIVNSWI